MFRTCFHLIGIGVLVLTGTAWVSAAGRPAHPTTMHHQNSNQNQGGQAGPSQTRFTPAQIRALRIDELELRRFGGFYPSNLYGYGGYSGWGYGGYGGGYGGGYTGGPNLTAAPSESELTFTPPPLPHPSGELKVAPPDAAVIRLELPTRFASVLFDGQKVGSVGTTRYYVTPNLDGPMTYTVAVMSSQDGRMVCAERQVNVSPGQVVAVEFE